jgi:hypothetical protein
VANELVIKIQDQAIVAERISDVVKALFSEDQKIDLDLYFPPMFRLTKEGFNQGIGLGSSLSKTQFEGAMKQELLKNDPLKLRPEWSSLILGQSLSSGNEKVEEEKIRKIIERSLGHSISRVQVAPSVSDFMAK